MAKKPAPSNPTFHPSLTLLAKLGSIVAHATEMLSTTGHYFDKIELEERLKDPEVLAWLEAMGPLIPKKR